MEPRVSPANDLSAQAPAERALASGDGWRLREIVCAAGPSDRAFEERHADFSIAAVLEGAFTYRSDRGRALLYPGALLLGNGGQCFECGHEHAAGDRCVALHIDEELIEEVAASAAGSSRFRFAVPSLPPSARTSPVVAALETIASGASSFRCDEIVTEVVAAVARDLSGQRTKAIAPSPLETRRVIESLRYIEAQATGPISLSDLAARAALSKYHFLRVFRRLSGVTPHQYLLGSRLRRAARGLKTSRRPVLDIALDCGFGDLSTFNRQFRRTFRMSPTRYRAD